MVKPYSEDLRRRVIAAVEEDGLSRREAARRYRVGESTAVKWLSAFHGSGRMGPRPMGGDRRSVLKQERAWLAELIGREKNLTLALISERLRRERGVRANLSMIWKFLRVQGFSFKKNAVRRRAGKG
jgi:putative transposase